MIGEEEILLNLAKTSLFTLFMLSIGVMFGPEWAIIALLSVIYTLILIPASLAIPKNDFIVIPDFLPWRHLSN